MTPWKSESISCLVKALVAARKSIGSATKDSLNPHFKNRYTSLSGCIEPTKDALSENGLALLQLTTVADGKMVLKTILSHVSGEWISGEYELSPSKNDPQGMGGAVTYARRYARLAILDMASEDDDGETASGRRPEPVKASDVAPPPPAPKPANNNQKPLPVGVTESKVREIFGLPPSKGSSR